MDREAADPAYRFEVAFSFAGDKDRPFVRQVAAQVQSAIGAGQVFFDEWFEAELAGPDAHIVLQKIYRNQARLVVASVTKRYNEKPWTQEEWRAIQSLERTLRDAGTQNLARLRLLPLRFGDGEIDGLFDTAIVPDVRERSPEQIANLILARLELVHRGSPRGSDTKPISPDHGGPAEHAIRSRSIRVSVQCINVLKVKADVLVLKHAQAPYGADAIVMNALRESKVALSLPAMDSEKMVEAGGALGVDSVLFIGVVPLHRFNYEHIRQFARRALTSLAARASRVESVVFTLHGPGFGLDEAEAFESELAGVIDSIESGVFPRDLEHVIFAELNEARAERLRTLLSALLPLGSVQPPTSDKSDIIRSKKGAYASSLRDVGFNSASKPHVFVAMPFASDMDDTFHYGIQSASNAASYLCERADLSSSSGDVVDWVKTRIATAQLVIADLSTANPNVYLEVGYAWGCKVPTILLARAGTELELDVRGQRCILYQSIKELESKLRTEFAQLRAPNPAG